MAKDNDPSTINRETTSVVTFRDFASRVKVIADHRNLTMAEALEQYAGPSITREYKRVLEEKQAELGGEG